MTTRRWPARDRWPVALVNLRGHGNTVRLDDLPAWKRDLFAAQLAYWQAAVAYERAIGLNVAYGIHVPAELLWEYDRARANWQPWLIMLRTPGTRERFTNLPTRKDYL